MSWQALLTFWFGELSNGIASDAVRANWFASDPAFDARCQQFEPLLATLDSGELDHWLEIPQGRLSYIILADQIPRNIYRGQADAFRWDKKALEAAGDGINQGIDLALAWDERAFFYMPFEHSERYVDQHTSVGLFSQLRDDVPKELKSMFGNTLRFAQQHRDIILRFGRFPHRNPVLGRSSTPAELAFAEQGDGFGQG